jgi:CheY-like chemotaxis protein
MPFLKLGLQMPEPSPKTPQPSPDPPLPTAPNLDKTDRMNRILLADDSPHAQRMGERILREEGYEVVSVTDGETAIKRLSDVDPDLIVADVFLPGLNGFDLCRRVKAQPAHRHVRVVMTAGMLEVFDEDEARRAGADAIIKKPFEASAVIATIKPLIVEAHVARGMFPAGEAEAVPVTFTVQSPATEPAVAAEAAVLEPSPQPSPEPLPEPEPVPLPVPDPPVPLEPPAPKARVDAAAEAAVVNTMARRPELDPELVRAAVTLALDEALPSLIDDIAERVSAALRNNHH